MPPSPTRRVNRSDPGKKHVLGTPPRATSCPFASSGSTPRAGSLAAAMSAARGDVAKPRSRSAVPGADTRMRSPSRASATMPIATASPCSSRKPEAASTACPMVWPKLSTLRGPASRSSRETTLGLDLHGTRNQLRHHICVHPKQPVRGLADPGEVLRVGNRAVLHRLREAARKCSGGERAERFRVRDDRPGRMKTPTRFLPNGVSTAVFPPTDASTIASRVVGTCTQGEPPHICRGDKAPRSPGTPPPTTPLCHGHTPPAASHP